MNFSDRLKSLRKDLGLTQEELANKLNKTRSTIAGYETERKQPDYETLNKIADYFNVSVDYLLGRTNTKKSESKPSLPTQFNSPEEAMKFVLEQNVIMGFGGFDVEKMSDEEIIEFANELLRQLKILSYKYKK